LYLAARLLSFLLIMKNARNYLVDGSASQINITNQSYDSEVKKYLAETSHVPHNQQQYWPRVNILLGKANSLYKECGL
jgi:hypothetical protein